MVGVPGKSRGCHTCRRRKIKELNLDSQCDRGQPSCQNCVNSERKCEGYETYPVFLNRTADGLLRRQRFEEMRPSARSLSSPTATTLISATTSIGGGLRSKRDRYIIYSDRGAGLMARHVSLTPIEDQAYIDLLCVRFLPVMRNKPSNWLEMASSDLPNLDPALKLSLKALTLNHAGVINNDSALRVRARELYGTALKLLQRALSDPTAALLDSTITLIRIVAFYELLDGKRIVNFPWINHQRAIESLLRAQGPKADRSPIEKAMFYESRRQAYCRSLMDAEPVFLERPEWQVKDDNPKEQLYNIGFKAVSVYLRVHNHARQVSPAKAPQVLQHVFVRCVEVLGEFRQWRRDFDRAGPHWKELPTKGELPSFDFCDFDVADHHVSFWSMLLLLAMSVKLCHDRFKSTGSSARVADMEKLVSDASGGYGVSDIATNIFRTIPYFLQEGMGPYAVVRAVTPTAIASRACQVFEDPPSDQCTSWTVELGKAIVKERLTIIPCAALLPQDKADFRR